MNAHEAAKLEIQRIMDGGIFNESFWQSLYNPTRDEMYRQQRERDGEIYLLRAEAKMLADTASVGGVHEKRAARKAAERVRKFEGVLRRRQMRRIPDEINLAWHAKVQWIEHAREAAVYLHRMNMALKSENAVVHDL